MDPVFEIRPTDDDGAAVYEVRAVLVATFARADDAEEYVRLRGGSARQDDQQRPDIAGISRDPLPYWNSKTAYADDPPGTMRAADRPKSATASTIAECAADAAMIAYEREIKATKAQIEANEAQHRADEAKVAEIAATVEQVHTVTATTPETGKTATATFTAAATREPSNVAVTERSLAVERKIDPYHPKAPAMLRLEAGEPLDVVALDLGLDTRQLKKKWSARKAELHSMGVVTPGGADPQDALDPDWHKCDRCRTPFNAVKAQKVSKLAQRPTLCATCRG